LRDDVRKEYLGGAQSVSSCTGNDLNREEIDLSKIQMISIFVALGILVLFVILHRRGGSQLADPHRLHVDIIRDFSAGELALAYNLTLTSLSLSREFGSSSSRINAEIEVARSLYVTLMKSRGNSITVSEKAKMKVQLTRLAISGGQKTKGGLSILELRVDQDTDEPENPDKFYAMLEKMRVTLQ